ncbi:class I SAM-dependent DNA methyltransferase [Kallotenue papyrolyticum]|uniref:class I SAM-dependent DNA methyltransferase n=1 Tax=Kallotenue papyrolyticum TaxID=1325125 RepID=UPI00049298A9|nr:class I SAM-dependent methyltransferase [Kallotenue papyrolyticum]
MTDHQTSLPPYSTYAAYYDRSGQIRFAVMMDLYLQELLAVHAPPGRRLLDLGCGTGSLALLMAERGWQALGLDRSSAMLREARRKAARAPHLPVRFIEGDLRDFRIDTRVDLITCCYDTLNYLLDEHELEGCFSAVARVLRPRGLFCFDLATDYFLRVYWNDVSVQHFDNVTLIMESHYDERNGLSTLLLTGIERDAHGAEQRFREVHVERAYPDARVRELLEAQGLRVEGVYDCFTMQPPREQSLRLMYVARAGEATPA